MADNCDRCGEMSDHLVRCCKGCEEEIGSLEDTIAALKNRERGILDNNDKMRRRLTAELQASQQNTIMPPPTQPWEVDLQKAISTAMELGERAGRNGLPSAEAYAAECERMRIERDALKAEVEQLRGTEACDYNFTCPHKVGHCPKVLRGQLAEARQLLEAVISAQISDTCVPANIAAFLERTGVKP